MTMRTELEQKRICLICKEEITDVWMTGFFCYNCVSSKKLLINEGEGIDLELHECARCNKTIAREYERHYNDTDGYVSLNNFCMECEPFVPILITYDQNRYDYELVSCKDCGIDFVDEGLYYSVNHSLCLKCEEKEHKIQQRQSYLAHMARRKQYAKNRKTEIFPNIYAKPTVEIVYDYEYVTDKKGELIYDNESGMAIRKYIVKKEKVYEFRCGAQIGFADSDLKTAIENHVIHNNCVSCRVLAGKSKANVMNQDHVMTLFKKGVYRKHTGTEGDSNYYSRDIGLYDENHELVGTGGELIHYSTTEAIRTIHGVVISNVQCWSAGWAKCSIAGADYHLPISTLTTIYNEIKIISLEVIQENESLQATLFKIDTDYLIYGRDLLDNSEYLVKIPKEAQTVQEALDTLKPDIAKVENVQRQGDIFFVPTNIQITETDSHTATWYDLEKNVNGDMVEFLINRYKINIDPNADSWDKKNKVNDFLRERKITPLEAYQISLDFTKANKRKALRKEKRNDQILSTNHIAEELKVIDGQTFVRGKITHNREQHTKFVLNEWYIAVKNLAVSSWQVDRRIGRGGFD